MARIAAKKLKASQVAMVVGRKIFLHNCTVGNFLQNQKWLRHELAHVRQYQRYGLAGFLILYLIESIRYGYLNNRFEREARLAEEQELY